MPGSPSHFVISNYNDDPRRVISFATEYTLYDQSDEVAVLAYLDREFPDRIRAPHTGHNLSDYFQFFLSNWERLDPNDVTVLAKGNIIGRHVTEDFFARVHRNQYYTFLYHNPHAHFVPGTASMLFESSFLERNDSWFADSKPHRYFAQTNQLVDFLYEEAVHPEWLNFSPGGCYIVPNSMVLRHPRSLFQVLHRVVSYTLFPAEAYMVERLMHAVFVSPAPLRAYLYDTAEALATLEALPDRSGHQLPRDKFLTRASRRLARLIEQHNPYSIN